MVDKVRNLNIESMIGIRLDLIVIALGVLIIFLIFIGIVLAIRCRKLRKSYLKFMESSSGLSLEEQLQEQMLRFKRAQEKSLEAERRMKNMMEAYDDTIQKIGLVKYNALDGMGGKLSFSVALLDRRNTGFVLNAVHSNEGCYTYMKEIIEGNSVLLLAAEEKEAVEEAMRSKG